MNAIDTIEMISEVASVDPEDPDQTLGRVYLAGPIFGAHDDGETWRLEVREAVGHLFQFDDPVETDPEELGTGKVDQSNPEAIRNNAHKIVSQSLASVRKADALLVRNNGIASPGTGYEVAAAFGYIARLETALDTEEPNAYEPNTGDSPEPNTPTVVWHDNPPEYGVSPFHHLLTTYEGNGRNKCLIALATALAK
jgi:hypothetical protein